jgi:hypothetical protein
MDDDKDKNVIEKLVDKINDAVENIATTASAALQHAMEADRVKPGEQVVFMPVAGDGLIDPLMPSAPMMPVVIPKKKRKPVAKRTSAKTPPKKATAKTAGKSSSKKAAKKAAKKTAKKSGKKSKSTAGRKPVTKKKTAKKVAKKKKAKKSRRK